jgi:hypothetical protein
MDYSKIDYTPRAKGMIDAHLFKGLSLFQRILELIDNSREYRANKIKIYLLSSGQNKSLYKVIIVDNGNGMLAEIFALCMVLGHQNTHDELADGKFGLGLKNATWGMGNSIIVLTKTADGSMRQQYLNLISMKNNNSLKPTAISEGIDLGIKAMVDQDTVVSEFESQTSGTLICVKDIIMDIPDVSNAAKKLKDEISLAYANLCCDIDIYTSIDTPFANITSTKDVFYAHSPDKRKNTATTSIRVYVEKDKTSQNNQGKVLGVFEELKGSRFGYGGKTMKGTESKPVFNKLWIERKKNKKGILCRTMKCEEVNEKDLPKCDFFTCPITCISIDSDVQKEEENDDTYTNVPYNRAGIWIYRNNRLMQSSYWPKDISNDPWCNYQRMCVVYPPELDYHYGTRTEKQLGEITSIAIEETLAVLYSHWNNATKNLRKAEGGPTKNDEKDEEEEEYDEERALSELYGSEDSSESYEPPKIVKTTKSVAAPITKPSTAQASTTTSTTTAITNTTVANTTVVSPPTTNVNDSEADLDDTLSEDETSDSEHDEDVATTTTPATINNIIIMPSNTTVDSNKTVVGSHSRNTPKSQKDAFTIFMSIVNNPKLPEKYTNASSITHPKWTQICAQLEAFKYEVDN